MRIHVLENPCAGPGHARTFLDGVTRALGDEGHEVTRYRSACPEDLAAHVANLGENEYDRVAIGGGDGTLRAVVNAARAPLPWPIGVLPAGTANLVARETGFLPGRPSEWSARALIRAEPWTIDLIEVKRDGAPGERAVSSVSAGVDGCVAHRVGRSRADGAASGGYGRWIVPSWLQIWRYPFRPIQVAVDERPPFDCVNVVIQNAYSYCGIFTLSPRARLDSGSLEVCTVHARSPRDLLRLALAARCGRFHRDRQVRIAGAQRVRVRASAPVEVQADGDPAGYTDFDVTLLPAALTLLNAVR